MYVAVEVRIIQGKSSFKVTESELRNSTVAEGRILVSSKNRIELKGSCNISWVKSTQRVVLQCNQPSLFFKLGVNYVLVNPLRITGFQEIRLI